MAKRALHTKHHLYCLGCFFLLTTFFTPLAGLAQTDTIEWLSFKQLEDSLMLKPKKVFINFYADWCVYCKKMDQAAFKNPKVVAQLKKAFYAVNMNAESRDTIVFGGDQFVNAQVGTSRNPIHQIPLLLASRENRPFALPAMIILNENFEVTHRYFEYLSPKKLYQALKN